MLSHNRFGLFFKSVSPWALSVIAAFCLQFSSSEAVADATWAACKPVESATFAGRVHVRCESAVNGVYWYFAASTADPKYAARLLSIFEAGQLSDKFINVLFDASDLSGEAFGCLNADCRTLQAAILVETRPGKCDIDNTQQGCPGYCAAHNNNDASCPGYCATHNAAMGCPGFCAATNNSLPSCPGYCDNHDSPKCANYCDHHPDLPSCGGGNK